MTTAGLLLAAGASRRFGSANKLLAPFRGRPLATHAAAALAGAGPDHLIAVTAAPAVAALLPEFDIVALPGPEDQSASLRAGVRRAMKLGADAVVIHLADMPLIEAATIAEVARRARAAVTDGSRRMPPAAFPAEDFEALLAVQGDSGARGLLAGLPEAALVRVPPAQLADVDTPANLAALGPG